MSQTLRVSTLMVAAALLLLSGCGKEEPKYTGPALPYTPEPPKAKEPNPVVALETTAGEIQVELFEDDTPNTVNNFVQLAEQGFYNGLLFHRIIKDFMVQGGDPQGTGMGGPGYKFPDETKSNPNKHDKYALSMANSGPNTNGSQFFIVTNPAGTPHLDGRHTVFGKVVKGQEAVDKLNTATVKGERPDPEMKIVTAKVLSKRSHKYEVRNTVADPASAPPKKEEKKEEKKTEEKKSEDKKPEEKKTEAPKTEAPKTEEKKSEEKK